MKEKIKNEIAKSMGELEHISEYIYMNPEEGYKEYKASAILSQSLEKHGFSVEKGIYGIETAFRGVYNSGKEGAKVFFLCEYDALPGIGHGCGHNLIATMGLGAGIGLKSVIDEIGGTVVVLGTPAEETSGAKVEMVRRGEFKGAAAAMMVHPNPVTEESGSSLALEALRFEYTGKAAHAAAAPEEGINALDAVIMLYNGINALRQHVTSDVRIHGIITHGGTAPNIVPEFAAANFYVRAGKKEKRDEVVKKVIACAKAAALMTGAKLEISNFEESYNDLRTNKMLSDLFNTNLGDLGEKEIRKAGISIGSIDMGNVSNVVPAIHPWLGLGNDKLVLHTREFAECTLTEQGKKAIYKGACAMAMTAFDVIASEEVQKKIRQEFEANN
ncbi:MAG: M20 family metallopeptidase [Caulobacteraceae bacterium]